MFYPDAYENSSANEPALAFAPILIAFSMGGAFSKAAYPIFLDVPG
jgi:hypothetical protein